MEMTCQFVRESDQKCFALIGQTYEHLGLLDQSDILSNLEDGRNTFLDLQGCHYKSSEMLAQPHNLL